MNSLIVRSATAIFCACVTLVGPASADQSGSKTKAVVELFTSQGCAQCPPADEILADLAQRDDIVALAYHVDYWDFMGWTDEFGQREFSDRQRAYAKHWGASRIFTPQVVINGTQGVIGSREDEVETAINSANLPLSISLQEAGDRLIVSIPADAGLVDAEVWAVTYLPAARSKIDAGDNAGRILSYTQIVTERVFLGSWSADQGGSYEFALPPLREQSANVAILLQNEHMGLAGEILAAATYQP